MQSTHNIIEGDQTAAEEHRDDEINHEALLSGECLTAECPACRYRDQKRQDNRQNSINNSIQIATPHIRPFHDLGKTGHGNLYGIKHDLTAENSIRIGDRSDNNKVKRIDNDQSYQQQKNTVNGIEYLVADRIS